ncbi:MAG: EamA family transporter RarD [Phycisphaerae bacterium]
MTAGDDRSDARAGALLAGLAFGLWGVLPMYWKQLSGVGAVEILAHRFFWAAILTHLALVAVGQWTDVRNALTNPRLRRSLMLSAALLGANGYAFVWGVNHGFILECSLGYYIAPLVNVALGSLVLRERLRVWQGVALVLAAAGVTNLIAQYGRVPWVGLTLAVTFGCYGLFRKIAPVGSLAGFAAESGLLAVPAAGGIAAWWLTGSGSLGREGFSTDALLAGAGLVTLVPLVLFAAGARRVRLSTLGFLQYIAPTLAFGVGVAVYREAFTDAHKVTFALVWTGVVVFSWDSLRARRRTPTPGHTGKVA